MGCVSEQSTEPPTLDSIWQAPLVGPLFAQTLMPFGLEHSLASASGSVGAPRGRGRSL